MVQMKDLVGLNKISFKTLVPTTEEVEPLPIIQEISKTQMTNLSKIFIFYAQQHMPVKTTVKMTFDQIENKKKVMGPSDFLKFCKDFEIPITRE